MFDESQAKSRNYKSRIDRIMQQRYDEKIDERSRANRQADKIALFNSKIAEKSALDVLFRGERFLNRIIGQILNFVDDGAKQKIFDFTTSQGVKHIESLYLACYCHHKKQAGVQNLKKIFVDGDNLSLYKKGKIIKAIESHYSFDEKDRKDLERLQKNKTSTIKYDAAERAYRFFEKEQKKYSGLVRYIDSIFRERELPATSRASKPVRQPPGADYLLKPNNSLLYTGMNLATAEKYLIRTSEYILNWKTKRRNDEHSKRYVDVLYDFFVSPDVFPEFCFSNDTWSLKEFITAVNHHLQTPVPDTVLDAFLTYCHHVNQLFYIGAQTRRISTNKTYGWVRCHEQPVGGPPRKVTWDQKKKSKALADLEESFLDNFKFDPKMSSLYLTSDVLGVYNSWKQKILGFVPRPKMDESTFKKHVHYWSRAGTFFVFRSTHKEDELIRVDNGWLIGINQPYSLLTPEMVGIPDEFVVTMERDLLGKQARIANALQALQARSVVEWQLYNIIYNPGQKPNFVSWTVSKQNFHVFLRFCSTANKLVK